MSFWLLKVAANQNRWKEQNHWKERLITIINRGAAFNLELSANAQLNAGRSGLKPTDYIIYKLIQKLYTVACSRSFSASIFYSRIHPHWRLFWSFLSSHRVSARGWPFRAGFWLIIKCHGNPTLKASIPIDSTAASISIVLYWTDSQNSWLWTSFWNKGSSLTLTQASKHCAITLCFITRRPKGVAGSLISGFSNMKG